jgi:two-component system, OmpR family, response regulator
MSGGFHESADCCRLFHPGLEVTQGYKSGLKTGPPMPEIWVSNVIVPGRDIGFGKEKAGGMNVNGTSHILIVDDDKELCTLLSKFLTRQGYRVSVAHNGAAMTAILETARINLVVLDLMLPGDDGLVLCRRLRSTSTLPIIMLTAMGDEVDRIIGLEMGADDYLPKVANPRELLARVRAVLRRAGAPETGVVPEKNRVLEFDGWRLHVAQRQLFSPTNALVSLRAGEFDLLLALAERPQRVMTRDQLLDLARGRTANNFDRSIDVQISRLRRKIEIDPKVPTLIKTVRNGGYTLAANVAVV